MTAAIALSAFAGMAIGLRFSVLMTMPATMAAMTASAAVAVIGGGDSGALLLSMLLSGLAVQVGFFCGSFAPLLAKAAPEPQDKPSPAHASPYRLVSE
jgi:hypothetical protein